MSTAETGTSAEAETQAIITEFVETFSKGDVEAILAMMDDDATWWVAGTVEGISGTKDKAGFGEMLGGIADSCEGGVVRLTPKQFIVQGNRAAVETESYADVKNGRTYNNEYHFVFEVRDGKILRVKEYLDTAHATAVFLAP